MVTAPYEVALVPPFSKSRIVRFGVLQPLKRLVKRVLRWRYGNSNPGVDVHGPRIAALAMSFSPDIVHAYDADVLPAAIAVKAKIGSKIIFDCLDLLGDVDYIDSETRSKLLASERVALAEVDAAIVVSDAMADVLEPRYEIPRPVAIYNGPARVMPSATTVHTPVRLFFQGSFANDRNLFALVEAMTLLRGRATLTLQGFGGVHKELVELVSQRGLQDIVSFVAACKPLEVVDCASEYDVGVICHQGGSLNMEIAVPNKIMDYLGAGLAVVASDLPGLRSIVQGSGAGILIDPSTSESIAEGLARLLDNPEGITEMKREALETAKRYEWPVEAAKLLEVYRSVLS